MKISALNETGKPVDWWFIYKVPQLSPGGHGTDSATGYEYVYYDSEIDKKPDTDKKKKVDRSPFLLNEGKGALNLTLNLVFKNFKKPPATTGWVLYNDEKPVAATGRDDGNLGHTKGVIAFDTQSKTAYWLLHSWPKFADPGAPGEPTPKYGQTYMCVSIDLETARELAKQMVSHQEPQTYLNHPANLATTDPLFLLMQPLSGNDPSDSSVIDLKSREGMPFKVIAKNRKWGQDFWNDLVGPTLAEDMDVESWIRGKIPPIADRDGVHKTFDIKYITMGPLGIHWAWPETHDHAKWGITTHSDWVCVGDINRMISQRKRGGGTIAFKNETLWKALSKTSLVLAPPGHSRTEAHKVIEATHTDPEAPKTKSKSRAAPPAKGKGRTKRKSG